MNQEMSKQWTVRDLMKTAIEYLREKGFDEARLTVELLLSYALHLQRIELYINYDRPVDAKELHYFRSLFERRLRHEPVQYIIQSAFFMGLQFDVDSRVLIPRPETETLVEEALFECKNRREEKLTVLDIGTGCGNIAISIAKYCTNTHITAVDKSPEAITVAKNNAQRHGVHDRIDFLEYDIFDTSFISQLSKYDLILSNPPYIPVDEWETLQAEVRRYEPKHALTDNGDGLSFYKQIVEIANTKLKAGGVLIVEVGYNQFSKVEFFFKTKGFYNISVIYDLQRIPRVVKATKPMHPISTN